MTIMRFANMGHVRQFMGDDYEAAYVPDAARHVLKRFDERSRHYDLRESRSYTANNHVGGSAAATDREADA